MKINEILTEAVKQRLDPKCWKGKHKEGTKIKGGVRVNNCVPNESTKPGSDYVKEATNTKQLMGAISGLAAPSFGQSRYRLDVNGSLQKLNFISTNLPNDPSLLKIKQQVARMIQQVRNAQRMAGVDGAVVQQLDQMSEQWQQQLGAYLRKQQTSEIDMRRGRSVTNEGVAKGPSLDEQFDAIEEMVEAFAQHHGVDADEIWEDFESVDDSELLDESAAWRRKEGKNKHGGLNKKGVASYRREHPGSKLQTAVTTKPSKLKPGSKAAKRRKSFCARMGGVKGPMKKPNGKPTRKALALRKWNC